MNNDESDSFVPTLIYKIPFLVLGIAIGMATVWVALQWLPAAFLNAIN